MDLTANQLSENWIKLGDIITNVLSTRSESLTKLYSGLEERIMFAPGSAIEHYHNAFPGGYVDHVLRVYKCAMKLHTTWGEMGADMDGYTIEELAFAAINHDLGKVGDIDNPYYEPNTSEWHRKNQGKIYDYNSDIVTMEVPHRGLWMLQEHGVKVTQNEYIAIMTHDGMYVEGNWFYYKSKSKNGGFKNNMPLVLHHADLMASRIEFERWKKEDSTTVKAPPSKHVKKVLSTSDSKNVAIFNNLFK